MHNSYSFISPFPFWTIFGTQYPRRETKMKNFKGKLINTSKEPKKKEEKVIVNIYVEICGDYIRWTKDSIDVYVNAYCYNQDGKYAEENDGMNQNCDPTSAHVSKLNHPIPCGKLEQQTRR